MKILQINGLTHVNIKPEQTVLEAMESAGLEPEFMCRDGHCGACKCELEVGEIEYVGFALAFTQPTEILPCICKAKSNLVLSKVRYQTVKKRA
ncbi:MAG TPA: (2Fe-2S)-binding protein [Vibrio sp.]|uniref:2Fe-2S iron-sulfur cluster-binding protein n=1 Tax=Vibrio sp. TaxID=678 RepID=UPI000ED9516D|nr:2Fe-2S iron-sulfur cluster-binding protein [Vibrio sp.]HCH00445.1 (2Fe-2S)-binding protein [Vibrio sp.]